MRKLSLLLLILASIGFYFWWDGDETPDHKDTSPATSAEPSGATPAPIARVAPRPQWEPQRQSYTQYTYPGYEAYTPRETYPSQPRAPEQYRFRPLSQKEKQLLEQPPTRSSPTAPPENIPELGAARGYAGEPSMGMPRSGYATGYYYSNPRFPGTAYSAPGDSQSRRKPSYRFRDFDPDEAAKRWTGDHPLPERALPRTRTEPGSPAYPGGWSPGLPYQRKSLPEQRPLWAAEG